MKQFILLSFLCCLLGTLSHALTFTGQVTDAKTGNPVPNMLIFLQDSSGNFPIQMTRTTSTGAYSITWAGTPTLGMWFRIWNGTACGVYRPNNYVRYSGSNPLVSDFSVCPGSANYLLQGRVNLGSSANSGPTTLSLIEVGVDASGNDSGVRSTTTFQTINGSNGNFMRPVQTLPTGRLYLKATLDPGHPNYGAYLPTYSRSSQSWHTAVPLTNSAFISDTLAITLIDTVRPTGPGCISGQARIGSTPLQDRVIILTTGSNTAVGFTYTDAQGNFSFTSLGLGTYKVHGDVIPKLNPALTMTLTGTKPCISNLVFDETEKLFSARLEALSVGSTTGTGLDELMPAPNPAQQELAIPGAERIGGSKHLTVRDLSGRVISQQQYRSGEPVRINSGAWPQGMYFLQLQTAIGSRAYRISRQ